MPVSVVFRVDASLQMGTGHVMRCLTLADALKIKGAVCHFICREQLGDLITRTRERGYQVHTLPVENVVVSEVDDEETYDNNKPAHSHWLGTRWKTDAELTSVILENLRPDWLVVDHYALDAHWESEVRKNCKKLMVIDDLADRMHDCDLLLDQTFGRIEDTYKPWVPQQCKLLTGSKYSLLRPEFAALRQFSLQRRENPKLEHILITM